MTGQCRCWYAIVCDDRDAPIATACFARFLVDALETTGPSVQKITRLLRRAMPKFMRFGVLFCGLPVPSAASHLRIDPAADVSQVLACLDQHMAALARKVKARMIVLKEFDTAAAGVFGPSLESLGYLKGGVPCAYELRGSFADGDAYLAALRSRYRRQIHESSAQGKLHGAIAQTYTGAAAAEIFDDHLHVLYRAVRDSADYRLETLPQAFFKVAARAFADDASLVVMRVNNEILGFLFGLASGGEYHNLYVGLDYARSGPAEVYFNLYTHDLDRAFRAGVTKIHIGQTSDAFKARLGAQGVPLFFFARAVSPLIQFGLRRFSKKVFPPVPSPIAHDVFRTEPAPRKSAKPTASNKTRV